MRNGHRKRALNHSNSCDDGPMDQVPYNGDDLLAGARRPDRGHRLPRLSWARLLRPGVSGKVLIGLFFATALTFFAVAFFVGHP